MLQFLIVSILDEEDLTIVESPFWAGVVGVDRLEVAVNIKWLSVASYHFSSFLT